jgi:hypothetical protein
VPRWREIAEGVLFKDGDIVDHGEAAEAASEDDDDDELVAPMAAGEGSLGIGSMKGAGR